MATTRIKDISKTTTDLASDTYGVFDGATNGTQKMARNDMYADWAAAYVAAPTTYKLAPLNSGTNKIDATYLPTSSDTPKGEWDANANSPALADGSGTAGDYYDVTTAGTQDLGSGSIAYTVGDVVKYNGSTWYKIDSVANILDGSATAADGRSTLSVNSKDEDAQANALKVTAPALYFNGSSSVMTVAHDAKQHFNDGTDDLPFAISFWVNTDFAVDGGLVAKYQSGAKEFVAWVTGSGLRFNLSDGTDEPYIQTASLTGYSNKWTHVTITSEGAGPNYSNDFPAAIDSLKVYVNAVDITSGATKQNEAAYGGLNNSSAAMTLMSFSGGNFKKGSIRGCKIFNRELTSTEVAELARGNDLGFSEEWGGAEVYTGDSSTFTSSLGNWSIEGAGITVAQSGGEMVITNTAASTGTRGARNISDTLTEGKRYRISWTSRVSSGTGQTIALSMFNSSQLAAISKLAGSGAASSVGSPTIYAFTPTGSAERHSLEFILAGGGTDSLYFNLANTGAGEVYNIDNITLKQIGTLADFRAERYDTSTNKLYDLSDNAFVGTGTSVTLTGREVPVYEHGTWTPTLSFSGGSTGITYGANTFGYYTRIGNVVHYSGYLTLTSKGTDTGLVYLGNLPFTVAAATDNHQSGITVGIASAFSGLSGPISGLHLYSDTRVLLYDWGATGTASLDDTNLTNTSSIRFSGTYQIS